VNATGVVLHTNLGRAPLAAAAVEAMVAAAQDYTNLEYDLERGERGSRYVHCASLLAELTGADAALVVNNAAAALVLALNTLARGRGVLVSRGELVEIGGGFRIPEMLERSGARLVEVGATNRTRMGDYERAFDEEDVGTILKVHRSNFRITGFTEEATLAQLAELARARNVPLVHDLGSGLMLEAATLGLADEPLPHDSLAAGSDLVTFSGDKLLGGPQAGLVVGSADLVAQMRANPLCRALRVDKVTLAGLEATLRLYRDPEQAREEIPVLRMLAEEPAAVQTRAAAAAAALAALGVA
jgi:L-seryl-tRNA(Ser) seleniumtransferase